MCAKAGIAHAQGELEPYFRGEIAMFRCDNCGSGYSTRAATWESCPRCYAREGVHTPLKFELGWRSTKDKDVEQAARGGAESGSLVEGAARRAAVT